MDLRPTDGKIFAGKKRRLNSSSNLALVLSVAPEDNLSQLISEWLTSGQANGLSQRTTRDYEEKVNKFWWWWKTHTHYAAKLGDHPSAVTRKEAREYAGYLNSEQAFRWGEEVRNGKTRLAPASIAAYGRAVKVFFCWLEAEGYIEETPFNKSVNFGKKHQEVRLTKVVEDEDLKKLFAYLLDKGRLKFFTGCRDLAIIALLVDSGIRRGELLNMKEDDLDLAHNTCHVTGKTGGRFVHYSEACRQALNNYTKVRNEEEGLPLALWLNDVNQPLSYEGFHAIIRRLQKNTGVAFHAHKLRHTFATTLMNYGMGIADLSKLMGHSKISTTQIYVHQDGSKLGAIYQPLSPLKHLEEVDRGLRKRPGAPRRER